MAAYECVFCAIVADEADASIVYEDADLVAFMDLQPVTPGLAHTRTMSLT